MGHLELPPVRLTVSRGVRVRARGDTVAALETARTAVLDAETANALGEVDAAIAFLLRAEYLINHLHPYDREQFAAINAHRFARADADLKELRDRIVTEAPTASVFSRVERTLQTLVKLAG